MIIDTKAGRFTLFSGERLRYDQLEALMKLHPQRGWEVVLAEATPVLVNVVSAYYQKGSNGQVYTIVKLDNGETVCSCPDFQHRRASQGGACKHIYMLRYTLTI